MKKNAYSWKPHFFLWSYSPSQVYWTPASMRDFLSLHGPKLDKKIRLLQSNFALFELNEKILRVPEKKNLLAMASIRMKYPRGDKVLMKYENRRSHFST